MIRAWAFFLVTGWMVWSGFTGLILSTRQESIPCEPMCWAGLNLQASNQSVQEFFSANHIPDSRQNGRYNWSQDGGNFTFLLSRDERLMRIDAGWDKPEDRPSVGQVLLWLGSPDGIRLESEVVANVRRLTINLTYVSDSQITFISLRRMDNDPQRFGQMRIRPDDRVLRISRYEGVPRTVSGLSDADWRGFAQYPVRQICC